MLTLGYLRTGLDCSMDRVKLEGITEPEGGGGGGISGRFGAGNVFKTSIVWVGCVAFDRP